MCNLNTTLFLNIWSHENGPNLSSCTKKITFLPGYEILPKLNDLDVRTATRTTQ